MFLTIRTRYVPVAADDRGSRWVARGGGHQLTMATDYKLGPVGSDAAAQALADRIGGAEWLAAVTHGGDDGRYVYVDTHTGCVLGDIDAAGTVADALRVSGSHQQGAGAARRVYVALMTGRTLGQMPVRSIAGERARFVEVWVRVHPGASDAGLYSRGWLAA